MEATFSVVLLTLLSCSRLLQVASFSLTISPDHVRTSSGSLVTVTCKAGVPLTGCQFTWMSKDGEVGPVLELRRGQHSRPDPTKLSTALKDYSYSGRSLSSGDCGITLNISNLQIWMVACRVQFRGGSWNYAWMDLFADAWHNPPNTVMPRVATVVPGATARLAVKSTEPLTECRFWLPGSTATVTFDLGAAAPNTNGRHTYIGTTLQEGECGLALANVSEVDNGPVVCKIRRINPNADDYRFIPLIVASPPSGPVFTVIQQNADVTATCSVGQSRPVANITWFLGEAIIRQDLLDDSPGDAKDGWRWPWMKGSLRQTVSLRLKPEDHGKILECLVSHVALAKPFEAQRKMVFTAKSSVEVQEQDAANIAMEIAKVNLEAARAIARAEDARAKNEEARTREEQAWATNAEEELQFERERRSQSLQHPPQSPQTQSAQS